MPNGDLCESVTARNTCVRIGDRSYSDSQFNNCITVVGGYATKVGTG